MIATGLSLWLAASGPSFPMDAKVPPRPPLTAAEATELMLRPRAAFEPGTPTTIYVNFDGITLGQCNPSDSKRDCSWYNCPDCAPEATHGEFPPFSGTDSVKVGVLQAMRMDASNFGIRITGVRPPDDEDYVMVIYGGTETEFAGALGSAPAGDCGNLLPNQIAFAHVDGELNDWVNGGATTALHEAGHTFGLDHIEPAGTIMFPSGDNSPTSYTSECAVMVEDTDLNPGDATCPEVNMMFCGELNLQNSTAVLEWLFGPPYVDTTAPVVTLAEPENGQYFQGPANFDIVLDIEDDLHPQPYSITAWLNDQPMPDEPSVLAVPSLKVSDLPIGDYTFHLIVADHAGNETRLDFDIEVGEDPPPTPDEGCGCRADRPAPRLGWVLLALVALRRRRR
jgi:MYXO-CTERM domain-containing protein